MPSEPRWVEWLPDDKAVVVLTCKMEVVWIDPQTRKIEKTWSVADATDWRKSGSLFPKFSINCQLLLNANNHRMLAWNSLVSEFRLWNFSTDQVLLSSIDNEKSSFTDAAFSQDGKLIAFAGGQSRRAFVYDIENSHLYTNGLAHPSVVNSVQFSNDGKELLTACRDGFVRIFDWKAGKKRLEIAGNSGGIIDAQFSPDMQFIATLGGAHQVEIWHSGNGELALKPLRAPGGSTHLKISPCSNYLFITGGQIRVVNLGDMMFEPDLTIRRAQKVSEVLANSRIIEGNAESLSSDEWMDSWKESRSWFRRQAYARD